MAASAALTASLPLLSTNLSSLPSRTSFFSERITFNKISVSSRNMYLTGKLVTPIIAQGTTESRGNVEKESKKNDDPFVGQCLYNVTITGGSAPSETCHILISPEGDFAYSEGQYVTAFADVVDKNGRTSKSRAFSIASSARGDLGDYKTFSLCVERQEPGSVASYLCDLKRGDYVTFTGPFGKEMLMPSDPDATIIMLATNTGIAPFRGFYWKMFFEEHDNYKFNGLAWLFFGVPTESSLLYTEELEKVKEKAPDNFRLDFALSDEGVYIQTRMAEHGEELWELLQKDNTYLYMSGLKEMEKGIDDFMTALAKQHGIDWAEFKKELKKKGRWRVEVY